MDAWNQLINTALLGSGKAGGADLLSALPGMESAQQAMQERGGDAEARLLETTALLYTYRRCGVQPRSETTAMATAEAETKPYCSAQAARVLKDILLAGSNGLLRLWLERCDAAGQVAPPDAIVALLDEAKQHKELRALVVSCCGKRGEWLGRTVYFNWEFLAATTAADDAEHWNTGSTDERKAVLQAVRATDPAAARAMLEGVWKQEKADVREALLQAMETGLSEADLPFLETATGDKSKRVQSLAYGLLMRIPTSGIVRAMEEALRQHIRLQTTKKMLGLISKTSLEITLPKALDKQLQDAIGKRPNGTPGSDEEFALLAMIGYLPPSFWETYLDATPARVLELFNEVSKEGRYQEALQEATVRHRDKTWASLFSKDTKDFLPALMPLLSGADQQAYLTAAANKEPDPVVDYYSEKDVEWDASLAPVLMAYVGGYPYKYHKGFYNAHAHLIPLSILPVLDSFAPPAAIDEKDYSRYYAAQAWQGLRGQIQTLLEMKYQTINAFQH